MQIVVTRKDVSWNYLGVILSLSINFILLPFLLFFLDDNIVGLWYVFQSIGGISVLFDFGFAPTFGRNIAYCWSGAEKLEKLDISQTSNDKVDFYLLKSIIVTCRCIYFIISLILLIILFFGGTTYIVHISGNLFESKVAIAWIIYMLGIFFNLYYDYYISCLRGVGAICEVNKAMVYGRMVQILLMIILLHLGYGLIGASISYAAYGLVFRGFAKYKFLKYENIGERLETVKTKISGKEIINTFRIVWYNAWRDGLVAASNYLANQATVLVCSALLSLNETGIYSISVQLAQGVSTIAIAIFSAYQPSLQSCYAKRDLKRVREILSFVIIVYTALFMIGSFLLCTFGIPIINLVKPDVQISLNLLIILLLYQFILKLRNCYTSYLSCTNRVIYGKSFILSAILGIILAVILMKYCLLGVYSLPIAQIISQIVYNMWKWSGLVKKELNLSTRYILKIGAKEMIQKFRTISISLR